MTTAVGIAGWSVEPEILVIGLTTGLAYAVLAAGIVLVFRATRVINFAHGEIGAFGAMILAKLVLDHGWSFWLALLVVLAIGAAVGAAVELLVIRRLFTAPRLIVLVATIGISQLLFVGQLLLPDVEQASRYPSPLDRGVRIGDLLLRSEHFMVLAFVPAIVAGLAVLLQRTPYGIAIRATAENPDRAELAGISTRRVSTLVWILAGVLSTLTAVLVFPLRSVNLGLPSQALGAGLLLRALTAALVGRLVSLPLALAGGITIGVVEAVCFANVDRPGVVDALLFAAVLALVLFRRVDVRDEGGAWSLSPRVRPIPETLRRVAWIRHLNLLVAGVTLAVAVALPVLFPTPTRAFLFTRVLIFAVVGLSVTMLIGWAGQLSLGQFAFVGLGAMTTATLDARGIGFGVALAYGAIAGGTVALLVGFPALRVRGLFLAVTTLAFAVASSGWLLRLPLFVGDSTRVNVSRGEVLGVDFAANRTYYYLCLFVLVGCVAVVGALRRSGIGRAIIAVRENERATAAFGISPARAKLVAFGVSGALAALAGGLFAGLRVQVNAEQFGPELSLQAVAMVVIGGLGSIGGALLGAVYVIGLPALLGSTPAVSLATSGIGLLILLLYLPGGLAQLAYRARDQLVRVASARLASAPAVAEPPIERLRSSREPPTTGTGVPLLVEDVAVSFGGRAALDGVTVQAAQGEIVGLIGANGAGKSTLMDVVSGFRSPDRGRVELFGADVTAAPAHERAVLGVGRVFQDARLFGDLTVLETVQTALEADEPAELLPSMLALPPSRRSERRKLDEAMYWVEFMGLTDYSTSFVSELSTGTRRIVELCCLVARGSRLLLLDEPTAGVAQRETEAFGPLIQSIRSELDATILLIEHDMPLVLSISDRVYCLSAGRCIAEGAPAEVRASPAVIAAYLGTDERAIARSGAAPSRRRRSRVLVAAGRG